MHGTNVFSSRNIEDPNTFLPQFRDLLLQSSL